MTSNRYQAALTDGEVAWLLHDGDLTPRQGSPLLALADVEPNADEASLRKAGVFDPVWREAVAVLAAPDRQIRMIIPGPAETLIQVFYGSRSQPGAGLVGCWLERDHLRVSFPWEEEDIAAITARVVLATPPPLAEGQEVSLSVGGLEALAGTVDALRDRLFSSLSGREPTLEYRFDQDDVRRQLEAGAKHNDARWLVTLLHILAPPYVSIPPEAVTAGFDELAATGIIRSDNGQWTPEPPLLSLASQWRSPLPAVAHEVIESSNGELTRYDHRITMRGDGPLTLIDYQNLASEEPAVSISSVDAPEYLDGLARLLQLGGGRSAAEWVYVLDPVEVRGLHDTDVVVGNLQPGTWYMLVGEEGAWAQVADPDGRFEGWASAAQVHRRSDPVEVVPDLEPVPTPVESTTKWAASHTVAVEGSQAWAAPDPTGPVITTLAGDVELQVVERKGDWAHVRAENGWEAWVDGRRLVAAGTSVHTSTAAPEASTNEVQAAGRSGLKAWTGGGIDLKALADGSINVATVRTKRIQLAAAGAMLISAFLSWAGGGGNAFDVPIAFLWKLDVEPSGFSLGIVVLALAVVAAVVVLVGNPRHQMIAGGVAVGIAAVFLLQYVRILTSFSESLFSALGLLFTDGFGIAPWLLLTAGVALLVRR